MSPAGRGRSSGGPSGAKGPRRGAGRTAPGGQGAAPRTGSGRGSGGPKHLKPQPRTAAPKGRGSTAAPKGRGSTAAPKGGGGAAAPKGGGGAAGPSRGPAKAGGRAAPVRGGRRGAVAGQRGTTPVRATSDASRRALGGEQVEGRHAVFELLLAGTRRTREVIFASDLDPAPILDDIIDLADELKVPLREVSRGKFEAMARTDAPQGVLAMAAPLREYDLADLVAADEDGTPPFLLVLDGVTDPGNLGALLRSAECAGVSGVILPRHRAAHVTPTVTKAAQGAVERLRMATVPGIPTALRTLRDAGVWTVGLDAEADRSLFALDLATEPVALVLGAEGEGISALARKLCDALVSIPMRGRLNSLNVSVAGALACFEVTRRRAGAGS